MELKENQKWQIEKGNKYFLTRNDSTLIAFTVGKHFDLEKTGFKIVGTHTDSPVLKLGPNSKLDNQKGFNQCVVQTYGGGLWHTWFDRPLKLAGKVIINQQGKLTSRNWKSTKAMAIIPNLAIHLQTMSEREKFGYNKESHLKPIWSTCESEKMFKGEEGEENDRHYSGLMEQIRRDLGLEKQEDILEFDLNFYDSVASQVIGHRDEFIHSGRIDNLYSTFCALESIVEEESEKGEQQMINVVAMFDHEECGSESAQGAASNMMLHSLKRILTTLADGDHLQEQDFQRALKNSFMVSADMAHGVHPNYSDKHQSQHMVKVNAGVVIKTNDNQRYATDSVSRALLKEVARRKGVLIQDIMVRNDSPCGSTIGPIMSTRLGVKGIDVGCSMMAMHSIKEFAGVTDLYHYKNLFIAFFSLYETIQHDLFDN